MTESDRSRFQVIDGGRKEVVLLPGRGRPRWTKAENGVPRIGALPKNEHNEDEEVGQMIAELAESDRQRLRDPAPLTDDEYTRIQERVKLWWRYEAESAINLQAALDRHRAINPR